MRILLNGRRHVDERVELLRSSGERSVRLGALVQKVEITSNRENAAEAYRDLAAAVLPEEDTPTIQEILATPFVLIGTEEQIADQLEANQERWGVSRYPTRADDLEQVTRIIERLA